MPSIMPSANIEFLSEYEDAVIALGNFDGVHIGHAAVINKALSIAKQHKKRTLILTFDPHPKAVLQSKEYKLLMSKEEKETKVLNMGADYCVHIKFDLEFAAMTAQEFIENIICDMFKAFWVVTGYNFHFGKGRSGNPELLASMAKSKGFGYDYVQEIKSTQLKDPITEISSTYVKYMLSLGMLGLASQALGRDYSILCDVKHHEDIKALLSPVSPHLFFPLLGTYIGYILDSGKKIWCLCELNSNDEMVIYSISQYFLTGKVKIFLLQLLHPKRDLNIEDYTVQLKHDMMSLKYTINFL